MSRLCIWNRRVPFGMIVLRITYLNYIKQNVSFLYTFVGFHRDDHHRHIVHASPCRRHRLHPLTPPTLRSPSRMCACFNFLRSRPDISIEHARTGVTGVCELLQHDVDMHTRQLDMMRKQLAHAIDTGSSGTIISGHVNKIKVRRHPRSCT